MAYENDPEEYTGSTRATKADPKGKSVAPKPVAPPVAVYNPPAEGKSHPKQARLAPAVRLDVAESALTLANVELTAARSALRSAEHDEGDAPFVGKAGPDRQS
jgi:hypothetical protein